MFEAYKAAALAKKKARPAKAKRVQLDFGAHVFLSHASFEVLVVCVGVSCLAAAVRRRKEVEQAAADQLLAAEDDSEPLNSEDER